jgi:polyisoprenyl-phosphate glycosyltransferase
MHFWKLWSRDLRKPITHSIIIPVYNNQASIHALVDSITLLAESSEGSFEAVFVIDGSPDRSLTILLERFPNAKMQAQVVQLSRNFGSFEAIRVGLKFARGEFIAVIAADLQEPPKILVDFFIKLQDKTCDIVVGRRVSRQDGLISSMMSNLYWYFYRRIINKDFPSGGVDVFACNRMAAEQISKLSESNTSLVGLLYWVGFRRDYVDYNRLSRHHGKGSWSLRKKFKYVANSVFAFTHLPITLLQVIGLSGIAISTIFISFILIRFMGGGVAPPGYTALMLVILASTSANLLGLGVIGSYVWRTYENGKNRPNAIVMKSEIF